MVDVRYILITIHKHIFSVKFVYYILFFSFYILLNDENRDIPPMIRKHKKCSGLCLDKSLVKRL